MDKTFKIEFKWISEIIHGRDIIKALTDKTYGYSLCQGITAVLLGFVPFILTLFDGCGFVLLLLLTYMFSYPLGGNLFRWMNEMNEMKNDLVSDSELSNPAIMPKPKSHLKEWLLRNQKDRFIPVFFIHSLILMLG